MTYKEDFTEENKNEMAKKLKKQERARAYYLKNSERIKEWARNNYYQKREERKKLKEKAEINTEGLTEKPEKPEIKDEKEGIPTLFILFALIGAIMVVLILNKQRQQKLTMPPIQRYREIDIGGGRIIKIPIRT